MHIRPNTEAHNPTFHANTVTEYLFYGLNVESILKETELYI